MFNTTITISGPGGNISYEMEIIKQALEKEGFKVNVTDSHPFIERIHKSCFKSMEEYLEHRRKLMAEKPREINLVAEHLPWGG